MKLYLLFFLFGHRLCVHTLQGVLGVRVDIGIPLASFVDVIGITALECLTILFVVTPTLCVMWNWIARPVFNQKTMSYWQCLGLVIAVKLLLIGG